MSTLTSPEAANAQEAKPATLRVGMIGFGTVGVGVYELLKRRGGFEFVGFVVNNTSKPRPELSPEHQALVTDSVESMLKDGQLDLLIEVAGGVSPVGDWVEQALKQGLSVVSANKELIAKRGQALMAAANASGARLLFEAAVAGGIPIVLPLKQCLAANEIKTIAGILNGTTNFMLTKMMQDGWEFSEALKTAQELGFAEADPTSDVEGFDAAYKISLLASLAFGKFVDVNELLVEGISKVTAFDIEHARKLGYAIRLLGLAKKQDDGRVDVRVHPMLVGHEHPLASINNEANAIWVEGDAVGETMFYGPGAGRYPTASAVCGDVLALAEALRAGHTKPMPSMRSDWSETANLLPVFETESRFYIRLTAKNMTGVIGELGKACGAAGVSLSSVLQNPAKGKETASIILISDNVSEAALREGLDRISHQETTVSIDCVLRVL